MFKVGDIVGYKNALGRITEGIVQPNPYPGNPINVVWAYWGAHKRPTFVSYSKVFLIKSKKKNRNLPEWF